MACVRVHVTSEMKIVILQRYLVLAPYTDMVPAFTEVRCFLAISQHMI